RPKSAALARRSRLRFLVVLALRLDDRGEGGDLLTFPEPHDDHALRRSPESLELLDRDADHGAAVRDQHHLVALADDAGAGELAFRLRQLDRLDSHPAASLARVLVA